MSSLDTTKNQSGAVIYIVDKEYRVIYFNKALQKKFPSLRLGEICYRALCGEDSPCDRCPLEEEKNESAIFYNKKVRQWVNVNVGEVEWPECGTCYLVLAREIQENNKNLFYNLTSISSYDELFEMNITANTYKILYHQEEKYKIPEMEGALDTMLQKTELAVIHPEDRQAFLEFWDLNRLAERFLQDNTGVPLRAEFRKKKQNGDWCWTQQTVVPLRYAGKEDRIIMCFVQDIDVEKRRQSRVADDSGQTVDTLTGLYTEQAFFRKTEVFLSENRRERYCLVAIDIEHFKLFNEWYGREAGDGFLLDIAGYLKQAAKKSGGIAGYFGDDDFCILLPEEQEFLTYLEKKILGRVSRYGNNAGFLPAFGIYSIRDRSIPAATMYDRASIAMGRVKGKYASRVCWYDPKMIRKMEEEHVFLSEIQRALEQQEFTFYLQPQCSLFTQKIVGMESLVRWNHPERGIVAPGEFIPMLEKNGFITELDLYIWDAVCSWLRRWLDQGHSVVPVSVNVSRVDLYTMDVPKRFQELTERYRLSPSLIKIEITESAYAEGYQFITEVVEQLRAQGFQVMMDDFGSGYSSLNMLKDVNVDVLKIDMKFLEMDERSEERGTGILEAVVSMARLMRIRIIAEGVETQRQMEFLQDIGCLYGQGYYFYRPVPIAQAQQLLEDEEKLDPQGLQAKVFRGLRIREILHEDLFSETMLNNILGGIVVYEVDGERIEIAQANEQYCKITGEGPVVPKGRGKSFLEYIYRDDYEIFRRLFDSAYQHRMSGAEAEVRYLKEDGATIWLHIRAFYLGEQDGRRLFYGSVSDATERYRREKMLESSQRALSAVVKLSENDESFMKLTEENRRMAASIFAQMSPGGMIGGYCEEGFPLYFANNEMVKLLGYETYEEFAEAIQYRVLNTIHPDDRATVEKDIGPSYYQGLEYTTTYRMPKKDGSWFWTLDKGKVVETEDGRLAIVSACTDISETMAAQQSLAERNEHLLNQNQELQFLNSDIPGGYHRCSDTQGFEFLYVSGRFLEMFGYTREELKSEFDNKFLNMVHPDDRKIIEAGVGRMRKRESGGNDMPEYRMRSRGGYIWVIDQSRYMEYRGRCFLQGIVINVTEMVELRDTAREKQKKEEAGMMGRKLETILKMAGISSWDWDIAENTLTLNNTSQIPGLPMECGRQGKNIVMRSAPQIIERSGRIPEKYRGRFKNYIGRIKSGQQRGLNSCEIPVEGIDGKWIWLRICCETFCDEAGNAVRAVGYYADITKEKQNILENREKMKVLDLLRGQALFDFKANLTKNEFQADKDQDRWRQESGCTKESYTGVMAYMMENRILPESREKMEAFTDRERLLAGFVRNGQMESIDYMRMYCGKPRWLRLIIHLARLDDTEDVFAYMFIMDIHAQKRQEQRLTKMAETDALTGLYNRRAALPGIDTYLKNHENEPAALIMFDLDNFKLANDIFGHAYGDSLLSQTAARLKGFFREEDIVCRMGGDEFLVLCKNIGEEAAARKLRAVLEALMMTYSSKGHKTFFSVSAGYAMAPEHGRTFRELYQKADIALFTAKMKGKNSFVKYNPSLKKVRYQAEEDETPEK